jgi:hypothetical protein
MRITESQLRRLIREEIKLQESMKEPEGWKMGGRPDLDVSYSYIYEKEPGSWYDAEGRPTDPPHEEIDPVTGKPVKAASRPYLPIDPHETDMDLEALGGKVAAAKRIGKGMGAGRMYPLNRSTHGRG